MTPGDVAALARVTLNREGLRHWNVKFNNAKTQAGWCDYQNKTVVFSKPCIAIYPDDENTDTVLHEIAHALTPGAEHGPAWAETAIRLGARPEANFVTDLVVPYRWIGWCGEGHGMFRHRRTWGMKCQRSGCDSLIAWEEQDLSDPSKVIGDPGYLI